jgi:adenine/guanine phosphoribosyltransferase-like PRPP-binding protein
MTYSVMAVFPSRKLHFASFPTREEAEKYLQEYAESNYLEKNENGQFVNADDIYREQGVLVIEHK